MKFVRTIDNQGLLGKLNRLDSAIEKIANQSETPSPFGWSITPIELNPEFSTLHIWVGADLKVSYSDSCKKHKDLIEEKTQYLKGKYRYWETSLLVCNTNIDTYLNNYIELIFMISSRFSRDMEWRDDAEEIETLILENY